jgi:8-oxo-dGTP pyrophosphatase MutT (NUDIX family)
MVRRRRRGTAIVDTPDGILVVNEGERTYYLPGGGARRGESRRSAAIRELQEETGLRAINCSYLFDYTSIYNFHKVFLIEATGVAKPRKEIKHLAYFNGSNVNVSDTARKIIELYHEKKNTKKENL